MDGEQQQREVPGYRAQPVSDSVAEQRTAQRSDGSTTLEELPDIPANFICPITHDLLQDPVILVPSGVTYERRAIEQWYSAQFPSQTLNLRCPTTNVPLAPGAMVVPNIAMRCMVLEWLESQGATQRAEEMRTACRSGAASLSTVTHAYPPQLRSLESRFKATLTIYNATTYPLERLWVGYSGSTVSYGVIEPGRHVTQPTYQSHPWVIVQHGSRHMVTVYIAQGGPQCLHVSGGISAPVVTTNRRGPQAGLESRVPQPPSRIVQGLSAAMQAVAGALGPHQHRAAQRQRSRRRQDDPEHSLTLIAAPPGIAEEGNAGRQAALAGRGAQPILTNPGGMANHGQIDQIDLDQVRLLDQQYQGAIDYQLQRVHDFAQQLMNMDNMLPGQPAGDSLQVGQAPLHSVQLSSHSPATIRQQFQLELGGLHGARGEVGRGMGDTEQQQAVVRVGPARQGGVRVSEEHLMSGASDAGEASEEERMGDALVDVQAMVEEMAAPVDVE